jgi:hypothetical protein
VDAETVEIHKSARPNSKSPLATTALLPTLTASLVPSTAATAIDVATGRIRTPVPSAV